MTFCSRPPCRILSCGHEAEIFALRREVQAWKHEAEQFRQLVDDLLTAEPETADDYPRLMARLRDRARELRL